MSWENSSLEQRVLSQPIRLHWAGWESDTFTLQRAGWQLAAEQDVYDNALQVFLKHPMLKTTGISDRIEFKYLQDYRFGKDYFRNIVLNCNLSSGHMIYETSLPSIAAVQAIDATPSFIEIQRMRLEDAEFFRTIDTNIQQVTLEKATLAEVLDFALQKQKPRQDEIRRALLKRDHLEKIGRNTELKAELRLVT